VRRGKQSRSKGMTGREDRRRRKGIKIDLKQGVVAHGRPRRLRGVQKLLSSMVSRAKPFSRQWGYFTVKVNERAIKGKKDLKHPNVRGKKREIGGRKRNEKTHDIEV